ncbi:right-handed parallel beta-helix repeat-containing protein [candidate division KSB1 bacterium]|nr:right-handed parallel beta-helix repeat-containing protein [candidate division KSB1 bacterium]
MKFQITTILLLTLCVTLIISCANKDAIANPGTNSNNIKIYYIDGDSGHDDNDGLSPESAWKSLDMVNGLDLKPGWQILLKTGTIYNGRLVPKGSGAEGHPIIIDKYGEGEKPRIDAWGKHPETLLLSNIEYYEISNLEITNHGGTRAAGRKGVHVTVQDMGVARHIHLKNLYVHDVNGSNVKDEGGGYGIHWSCSGDNARFDDLLIANCHLVRTDRNGITGWATAYSPGGDNWNPSTNVVIRNNLLENIGGDGIVPIGTDGCLVEYNTLQGGRMRAEDYAAGIWPWGCTNTVIQYNEVSGMKGTKDGQSFDCDYECSGTIIQYNYSHDNDGGFLLVCGPARSDYGCRDSIIRYNISQNDGSDSRIFHISGGSVSNTRIYNNTIYSNLVNTLIKMDNWEGWPENTYFYNNIFYIPGRARYSWGQATGTVFKNNVFFGNHTRPPDDVDGITEDPLLVNPGSGYDGFDTLDGYKLKDESPCIRSGKIISDNGRLDFWGNPVPSDEKPTIGAHQK